MSSAGFDLPEYRINGRQRHADHRVTKMLERCRLCEGANRTQEGNVHGLFQRQAGRHDFPEQTGHFLTRQRPRILFLDAAKHLGLPLGAIEKDVLPRIGGHFNVRHFLGTGGPGTDQLHDLLIKLIDLVPQLSEPNLLITHDQPRSFANSVM